MADVLTLTGEQYVCDYLSGASTSALTQIGWGTGAGTAAKADTTLFTEVDARVTGTRSTVGTLGSAVFRLVGTMTAPGARSITNMGAFTVGGALVFKSDFGVVTLATNDTLEMTFNGDPS